jgi:drug/metabolite transporter (DMT)-like permease
MTATQQTGPWHAKSVAPCEPVNIESSHMEQASNLQHRSSEKTSAGWINGLIGVVIFSGSLPATRIAVLEFAPVFLTVARASIAGVIAVCMLLLLQQRRPAKNQLMPLFIVAMGVVVGFPLLTALALQYVTSAHSIVFVGLLPLATAVFGVLRGGERPRPVFWLFSILGSSLVVGFAFSKGVTASPTGDLLMLLAILVCGLGYAEGAKLSRTLGGWQVICWALVLALPGMLALTWLTFPPSLATITLPAWVSLGYVSLFSMLIGFVFWYRGLAQGGIAAVGQLQLLQPFFGLALAATLLHEQVSFGMLAVTLAVILCVAGARRFSR